MPEYSYTRIEYERRFLVSRDAQWKQHVEAYSKRMEDKYLRATRLRLRSQVDSDTGRQLFKLTKKLASESPYFQTISRILLSAGEYELLGRAEGDRLTKTRYYHEFRGHVFSLDVFEAELEGLVLCETEADSLETLMSVELPTYVSHEVTQNAFFTGGNLCRATRSELAAALSSIPRML